MIVRRAFQEDLAACAGLDATVETDHVWQMDERSEGSELQITFRQARLPRPMRVSYPQTMALLEEEWERDECFLVASQGAIILGFVDVRVEPWNEIGWVHHLVVSRPYRRRGIGARLIQSAADWARRLGLRQLMLQVSTKNYPGLVFCQRLGGAFCGYNDRLCASQDIALFFSYPVGT
jgi:GNAT superfamily N-acetyltransferase